MGSNRCFIDPHIKALLTAKAARRALSAKKEFSKVLEMLEGEELLGTRYNAMLTGTTNETKHWRFEKMNFLLHVYEFEVEFYACFEWLL